MTELKPCPFCGLRLELYNERNPKLWIHPKNDCFLAIADSEFGNILVAEDEVDAWNRRAGDD